MIEIDHGKIAAIATKIHNVTFSFYAICLESSRTGIYRNLVVLLATFPRSGAIDIDPRRWPMITIGKQTIATNREPSRLWHLHTKLEIAEIRSTEANGGHRVF